MTKSFISDLSTTAGSNTDLAGVGVAGSNLVSQGDNAFRSFAAMVAQFYEDLGGLGTVGGTGDAITLTAKEAWTAYGTGDGQINNGTILAFKAGAANTGAVTLNVNAIGTKAIQAQGDTALAAGSILANGVYLLRYDTAYNAAAGAWVLLNAGQAADTDLTALALGPPAPLNLGLATSVGSSALTIALKGADGSDPSASNPVVIPFRNVTAGTGTPSYLTATAATSLVISSGSTMGFTSGVIGRLWIVAFNDGGTLRLGAVNARSGTSVMALRNGIYSSTAEGGAGGADSAQVIYTGTAVTSKAMTILGYIELTEATAGTWATNASLVKVFQPGDALPGEVVQIQSNEVSTYATGTVLIPVDNTIPQITEGTQFMTQAITPVSGANLLKTDVTAMYGVTGAGKYMLHALFRDAISNAIAATAMPLAGAGEAMSGSITHTEIAGSTTATTLRLRAGPDTVTGPPVFAFGGASARWFGATPFACMTVTEIMA